MENATMHWVSFMKDFEKQIFPLEGEEKLKVNFFFFEKIDKFIIKMGLFVFKKINKIIN